VAAPSAASVAPSTTRTSSRLSADTGLRPPNRLAVGLRPRLRGLPFAGGWPGGKPTRKSRSKAVKNQLFPCTDKSFYNDKFIQR
jgi:hypothetical protein